MSRLDKIQNYGAKKRQEEIDKKNLENGKLLACRLYAESISDRIKELVETAQVCKENRISVDRFRADALSHQLGFYAMKNYQDIDSLAMLGGGVCGSYDTIISTNGNLYSKYKNSNSFNSLDDAKYYFNLEGLGKQFDTFETEFYNYVDSVVGEG